MSDSLVEDVADRLERLRVEEGLSRTELAAALDVHPGRITRLLQGRDIKLTTLARAAKALGRSVAIQFPRLP